MDYSAILVPLITLLISQALVFDLGQFRFSRKKVFFIFGIVLVVEVLFSSILLMFAGLTVYAKWYVPIMVVPAYASYVYLSRFRDARDLFTIVTTIFINFVVSIPAIWLTKQYNGGYIYYNLIRIGVFVPVFYLIHTLFREHYLHAQEDILKGWGVFSLLPLLGSAILYNAFLQYGIGASIMGVLYVTSGTVVGMTAAYIVIFYMFQQVQEKYLVQEQQRTLTLQNKAQLDQHILFRDAAEKSNRRWHDLRHNTLTLIALLESGKTEEALGYLHEQIGIGSVSQEEYCLHSAVNSILCMWAERARKEGIPIEIQVTLPEVLAIEPVELSALFSNVIENAYIACLSLPEGAKRFIKVEAKYNGKRLAIGVTNSCDEEERFEGPLPISSKEGGGIGTRSMVYTVKRFQGTYSFSSKDGVFFTRFVLNV